MNNIFDVKRFWHYFLYDLKNACSSSGLSIVVLGASSLVLYFFFELNALVFGGSLHEVDIAAKFALFVICILVLTFVIPNKLYGGLTEKKEGSNWILIPASSFEKFLSMGIVLTIVVPCFFLAEFALCDMLFSVILPYYGESLALLSADKISSIIPEMQNSPIQLTPWGFASIWTNLAQSILAFGLGAICFKKSKVAKTMLVLFAAAALFSMLFFSIFDIAEIEYFFESLNWNNLSIDSIERIINWIFNIITFTLFAVLLGGLYYRVRTIKH